MSKTIKVSEAKQGEWYHDTGRVLFAFRDGQLVDYDGNVCQLPHFEVHPAEQTGWDWEPEADKPREFWWTPRLGQGWLRFESEDDVVGRHGIIHTVEVRPGDIGPDKALELLAAVKLSRDMPGEHLDERVFDLIDELEDPR